MGCGGSKDGESNPNEIKFDMKPTKVPELDDFFKSASEFLEGIEGLRSAFQDSREEMHELGRTDELVTPSLLEAIKVFFWSVSAHKDGNIKAAGINYTTEPPAFTVECGHMDVKTYEFSAAMKELIGGLIGAPKQIVDLSGQVKDIGEKANSLKSDVKAKIDASSLDIMGKGKASVNAGINFATVLKGVGKAPDVLKQSQAAVKDVQELLPKIKAAMDEADVIGKEASGKGMKKMDEIFDHYQKAPKKTPEQIKEEHKGKKPKKGKKKGDKKDKKDKEHKDKDHKEKDHKEHKDEHKDEHKGEHKDEHKGEAHH
jgi:hypothetical protein